VRARRQDPVGAVRQAASWAEARLDRG